jgi:hypothetical protein
MTDANEVAVAAFADLHIRGPRAESKWEHAKTGKVYVVRGLALRESDLAPLVVYSAAGDFFSRWWVRPLGEFLDGRFVRLDPPWCLGSLG